MDDNPLFIDTNINDKQRFYFLNLDSEYVLAKAIPSR